MITRVRIVALVASLVVSASPSVAAKTTRTTTGSKLAFALWTTREDLAPQVYRFTNWYVEMSAGSDGIRSKLLYERVLCQDVVADVPCVIEETRDGSSRSTRRRFSVARDMRKASLDATFDVQPVYAPGLPVGPRQTIRVKAAWAATDKPVRSHGVTRYDGRCAYEQEVRETAVRAAATGVLDGVSLGKTNEARIVASTIREERTAC